MENTQTQREHSDAPETCRQGEHTEKLKTQGEHADKKREVLKGWGGWVYGGRWGGEGFNLYCSIISSQFSSAANFPSIRTAATAATCWLVVTVVFSALQVNTEEVKEKELEEKEDIDVRLLAH